MNDRTNLERLQPNENDSMPPELPLHECIEKVVVAIHGIGSQRRCDTVRTVADQFGLDDALPLQSLGYFSPETDTEIKVSRLAGAENLKKTIGFAEVYWADIPRQVVPPRQNTCRPHRTRKPGGVGRRDQWLVSDRHSRTGR